MNQQIKALYAPFAIFFALCAASACPQGNQDPKPPQKPANVVKQPDYLKGKGPLNKKQQKGVTSPAARQAMAAQQPTGRSVGNYSITAKAWEDVPADLKPKFANALKAGKVRANSQAGIKALQGKPNSYELKILGSTARIVGTGASGGKIIFNDYQAKGPGK